MVREDNGTEDTIAWAKGQIGDASTSKNAETTITQRPKTGRIESARFSIGEGFYHGVTL